MWTKTHPLHPKGIGGIYIQSYPTSTNDYPAESSQDEGKKLFLKKKRKLEGDKGNKPSLIEKRIKIQPSKKESLVLNNKIKKGTNSNKKPILKEEEKKKKIKKTSSSTSVILSEEEKKDIFS